MESVKDIEKQIKELEAKKAKLIEEEKVALEKDKEKRKSEAIKAFKVIKQYAEDYGEFRFRDKESGDVFVYRVTPSWF